MDALLHSPHAATPTQSVFIAYSRADLGPVRALGLPAARWHHSRHAYRSMRNASSAQLARLSRGEFRCKPRHPTGCQAGTRSRCGAR